MRRPNDIRRHYRRICPQGGRRGLCHFSDAGGEHRRARHQNLAEHPLTGDEPHSWHTEPDGPARRRVAHASAGPRGKGGMQTTQLQRWPTAGQSPSWWFLCSAMIKLTFNPDELSDIVPAGPPCRDAVPTRFYGHRPTRPYIRHSSTPGQVMGRMSSANRRWPLRAFMMILPRECSEESA